MPTATTNATDQKPNCLWCGTNKHVAEVGPHHFYCGKCKREFDDVDDGDIGYGRPSKRKEYQERSQERK